ncbi:helix-turn-helix transcriptional regulator [Cellulomonas sp. NPDC058312]|uniref:helix-turn-helix transcriptional regulator n=1 Tax=Cellulomonas sp. NPDC058312 TaxID=3346441 RepID=UPI0036F1332D
MVGRLPRDASPHLDAARRLADAIRARRIDLDLTQQAVAERAGVAYGTVRAIERRAVVDPGVFTISSIARALDTTVDELLGRRPRRRTAARPTAR